MSGGAPDLGRMMNDPELQRMFIFLLYYLKEESQ